MNSKRKLESDYWRERESEGERVCMFHGYRERNERYTYIKREIRDILRYIY